MKIFSTREREKEKKKKKKRKRKIENEMLQTKRREEHVSAGYGSAIGSSFIIFDPLTFPLAASANDSTGGSDSGRGRNRNQISNLAALEIGNWKLEIGNWKLEIGNWFNFVYNSTSI